MTGEQRRSLGWRPPADVARAFAGALFFVWIVTARAAEPCAPAFGRVVSVQGNVELRRPGANWQAAELNAPLCAGDMVRVHQRSRTALLLSNETTIRLDQGTVLTLTAPDGEKATLLEQVSGGMHVITRTPKAFRVRTPFVNANVEGTEFLVRVDESDGRVTVYEGRVVAENDLGNVVLVSGEEAVAAKTAAPKKEVVVRPRDAVAWTLYFPAIFDYRLAPGSGETPADIARRRSIDLYRSGRLVEALALLENVPEGAASQEFLTYRAGLLLLVGRQDEARPEIERALRLDPDNSDALALMAIIAVVDNDKDTAIELADKAVNLNPKSPGAWISRSYSQQAQFRIEEALASALEATKTDGANALAWARVAELELSVGNLANAQEAAQRAVALAPDLARTQSVLGFANLARIDTRAAKDSFERSITLDQTDPLPRLGLGLARIREGDLEAGRQEIEIATSLDPGNSIIRSYLGKAYYEERRDKLAGAQFTMAKALDPKDPTPYYYDAIRKQSRNDPVGALQDINDSIGLNNNRSVYRSTLLLDDDKATRTTSASNIYGDLGFQRLAIVESAKALGYQYGNDQAHRQLAIAYKDLPRHDIARVSESLQSQLRQPLTASPLSLLITTDNLGILRDTGPSRVGDNEFNLLFSRDQTQVQLDMITGNRGVVGDQLIVSGLAEKFSYAVSQLHYQTEGFVAFDEKKKDIYDLFLQTDLSPSSSVQLELKGTQSELSQVFNSYDPDPDINSPMRITEKSTSVRLGGRYTRSTSSNWIYTFVDESRKRSAFDLRFNGFFSQIDAKSDSFEIQNLTTVDRLQILSGFRYLSAKDVYDDGNKITNQSKDIYVYGTWNPVDSAVSAQAGLSYDSLLVENTVFTNSIKRHRLSPKLGVVWSVRPETTIRLAAFSSIKRPLIANQTIEPTQLAGFNQFFTGFDSLYGDRNGTISDRAGFGIDHKFSRETFFGGELTKRRMTVPSFILDRDFTWNENTANLYFYRIHPAPPTQSWLSGWRFASGVEAELEKISRPAILTDVEGIRTLKTYYVPLRLKAFSELGWSVGLSAIYIKQSGVFQLDEGFPEFPKDATGWTGDFAIDYRLPERRGIVSIGTRNVFDRRLDAFNSDPFNPLVAPARTFFMRARLMM